MLQDGLGQWSCSWQCVPPPSSHVSGATILCHSLVGRAGQEPQGLHQAGLMGIGSRFQPSRACSRWDKCGRCWEDQCDTHKELRGRQRGPASRQGQGTRLQLCPGGTNASGRLQQSGSTGGRAHSTTPGTAAGHDTALASSSCSALAGAPPACPCTTLKLEWKSFPRRPPNGRGPGPRH